MKGYFKHFEKFTPFWPPLDPYREGVDHPKIGLNIFWPVVNLKLPITQFRQKWHLNTFSTTVFNSDIFYINEMRLSWRRWVSVHIGTRSPLWLFVLLHTKACREDYIIVCSIKIWSYSINCKKKKNTWRSVIHCYGSA